jgi:hypothetical protein
MDQSGSTSTEIVKPSSVPFTLVLVYLNALVWFLFGLIVALGMHPAMPSAPAVRWTVAVLGLGCGICMAGLGWSLSRRIKAAFWATVAILVILTIATVLDEVVGFADLLALVIILLPLILLIKDRGWYLRR